MNAARLIHVMSLPRQKKNVRTNDHLPQDLQAVRLPATVAVGEDCPMPQALATMLVVRLVVMIGPKLNGVEVFAEALAPEGIVVAINSIVSVAAYQTEGA